MSVSDAHSVTRDIINTANVNNTINVVNDWMGIRDRASRETTLTNNVIKVGGWLRLYVNEWTKITSDKNILQIVNGYEIPFNSTVKQYFVPKVAKLDNSATKIAIDKINNNCAVRKTNYTPNQFISSYFLREKPNGENRFILNFKALNKFITTTHFKLKDIRTCY